MNTDNATKAGLVQKSEQDMLKAFHNAHAVSVPIAAISTTDQFATEQAIVATADRDLPMIRWDAVNGLQDINQAGANALSSKRLGGPSSVVFTEALVQATQLPRGTLVFAHNAHRQIQAQEPAAIAGAVQAIANIRQTFQTDNRMLVLMGPDVPVPLELEQSVMAMDHPLPSPEELETVVKDLHVAAKLKAPSKETVSKAVDALSGLCRFAAEQETALSMTEEGLSIDALWERSRRTIERAPGLSVWRGGETFKDIVGLESIKRHLSNRRKAKTPVGVVLYLDEIDKAFANIEGDTSGTRMDQFRTFLTEMENNEWPGLVAVGVPGAGKSLIAKAFGNEAGVPTIAIDLGGMQNKFVGESEANVRNFMRIAKAVGRGNAYVIATSNNATVMRPELQRRFTDGMWFFDLMTEEERLAAFNFFIKKYELKKQPLPAHDNWTAAEIRNCCRYAWDCGVSLVEASQFIVPMATSRADTIQQLRRDAHGRYLDASKPGSYQFEEGRMRTAVRAITLTPSGKETMN